MNVLFFGDVVGRPGRAALVAAVPVLREQHHADLVIANVENVAHGFGITPDTIAELQDAGVDYFTSGNHVWDNEQGVRLLATNPEHVLRPANFPSDVAGRGWARFTVGDTQVLLVNLQGQVFMKDSVASPFDTFDAIYNRYGTDAITLVDLHAEATGEKMAFGWHVDGRASLVVGTHTHIQTADEHLFPDGTAYISDLGFSGATESSLGMDKDLVLMKVARGQDVSLEPPENPRAVTARGVVVEIDPERKKAVSIARIDHCTTV